jgi:hypothetical protein
MGKRAILIVGLIVLAAGAFGAGVLVQRQIQNARIRAGVEFARDLAGVNDPVPSAPKWEDWLYPKAKVKGSAMSAAVRVSQDLVHPGGRYAVLVTKDDFVTVARFYAERLKFDDPAAIAKSELAFSSQGNVQGVSIHVLDDYRDVEETQKPRPVRTKCLVHRSPSYDLSVFINRAESESETHIVLLYNSKAETP